MLKTLVVMLALSIMVGVARAQDFDPAHEFTPEYGERLTIGKPLCELPKIASAPGARAEQLPLGAGTIELPPELAAEPQKRPKSKSWTSTDKTQLTVLVDSFPMSGLASSGPAHFESTSPCVLSISGHRAVVDRVRIMMKADTIYLATIPVFAKPGGIVNVTIQARSAQKRDELISRFAKASLTGR